ncbi:MAG TPA: hypothetical protein DEP87_01900 [Candidatus Pacebacteria bacterium]|nr:hypothetical protein [Candidatus Paceibacterota bacterium]
MFDWTQRLTRWQLGLIIGGFCLSLGLWFWLGWLQLHRFQIKTPSQTTSTSITPTPSPTPDPLAPINVALLGFGGGSHQGGLLTDTIIVAKIKPKLHQVLLISIPRDLWVEIPEASLSAKINSAYALGFDTRRHLDQITGGKLAKTTLGQVLNQPIAYYAAVSFSSFENAIDSLGGVTLKVPMSFTDEFYPIEGKETESCDKSEAEIAALSATLSGFSLEKQFGCRYEKLEFTAGTQTLDAAAALKFVRSRHSDTAGNDFNRSLRQQALIQGIVQKLLTPSVWPKLPKLASQILKSLDSDITADQIGQWLLTFPNPQQYKLHSFNFNLENSLVASHSADGQYILVPKPELGWSGLQQIVSDWEMAIATQASQASQASQSAIQSGI